MKNTFKKIGALALVLVMMLAMSATAFAADDGTDSLGTGNSVTIKDKLIAYNPDETQIYAPAVTFSYSIAAGTGGVTVTDSDSIQAVVLAGDWSGQDSAGHNIAVSGTPSITASNSYAMTDTLNAAAAGNNTNEKDIVIDFSSVTFPKPGIYRYTVTRTITDANNALENSEAITRSLDVYVKEENGTRSIYGYILHDIEGEVGATSTTKYDHYESEYKTSNLTVSKTLVNDAMMNSHMFPFSVSFSNTKGAHIKTSNTGTSTVGTLAAGAVSDTPAIAHGASVKYIGIPNGFTASVYETNNVTGTSYKSQYSLDEAALTGDKILAWGTGAAAQSNTAVSTAATDETKTVGFTNTLAQISPTGVVMRVAPYVLILAAGVVLLALSLRRRNREDA